MSDLTPLIEERKALLTESEISMKSSEYEENNDRIWRESKGSLEIRYLVYPRYLSKSFNLNDLSKNLDIWDLHKKLKDAISKCNQWNKKKLNTLCRKKDLGYGYEVRPVVVSISITTSHSIIEPLLDTASPNFETDKWVIRSEEKPQTPKP